MATTGMIHVRVDEDVKHPAIQLKVPNPVTQAAMEEARTMAQARFANAEELLDILGKTSKP